MTGILLAATEAKYQWFYWAAPLLMIGVVLALLSLSRGYIKKVFLPKHRGRRVEE